MPATLLKRNLSTGVSSEFCKMFENTYFVEHLFLVRIHSIQGLTATTRHGVTNKRNTKRLRQTGNLFRKNLQLKDVC